MEKFDHVWALVKNYKRRHTITLSHLFSLMAVERNGGANGGSLHQRKGDKNGGAVHTTSDEGKKVDALLDQHIS